MPPIQTLRLAAVSLLLTAGLPLLPTPDPLLPAVAQTVSDRKDEGDREAARETNYCVELKEFRSMLLEHRFYIKTVVDIRTIPLN